jgi:hypothetical protein
VDERRGIRKRAAGQGDSRRLRFRRTGVSCRLYEARLPYGREIMLSQQVGGMIFHDTKSNH